MVVLATQERRTWPSAPPEIAIKYIPKIDYKLYAFDTRFEGFGRGFPDADCWLQLPLQMQRVNFAKLAP